MDAGVRQAYLQSAEPVNSQIYIEIFVPKFESLALKCLQLVNSLYGLFVSGDIWHKTQYDHHRR